MRGGFRMRESWLCFVSATVVSKFLVCSVAAATIALGSACGSHTGEHHGPSMGGPGSGGVTGGQGGGGRGGPTMPGMGMGSGGVSGATTCTPGMQGSAIVSCGYPYTSSNPLTSVVFNEDETLRAIQPTGGAPQAVVQVFYNDEH